MSSMSSVGRENLGSFIKEPWLFENVLFSFHFKVWLGTGFLSHRFFLFSNLNMSLHFDYVIAKSSDLSMLLIKSPLLILLRFFCTLKAIFSFFFKNFLCLWLFKIWVLYVQMKILAVLDNFVVLEELKINVFHEIWKESSHNFFK